MNNDVMMGQVSQKVGMRSGVDTKKVDTGRNYLQIVVCRHRIQRQLTKQTLNSCLPSNVMLRSCCTTKPAGINVRMVALIVAELFRLKGKEARKE